MKIRTIVYIACVLGLASCAHFHDARLGLEGFNPKVVRQPQPLLPNVFVVKDQFVGRLVVDQEPIRITKKELGPDGWVTISWALAAGSPHVFVNRGIDFPREPNKGKQPPEFGCQVEGSVQKIAVCKFKPAEGHSEFKYAIHVENKEDKGQKIAPLDPYIVSDI
jgi:hypothetical protein